VEANESREFAKLRIDKNERVDHNFGRKNWKTDYRIRN
jgi:hypothetical protein